MYYRRGARTFRYSTDGASPSRIPSFLFSLPLSFSSLLLFSPIRVVAFGPLPRPWWCVLQRPRGWWVLGQPRGPRFPGGRWNTRHPIQITGATVLPVSSRSLLSSFSPPALFLPPDVFFFSLSLFLSLSLYFLCTFAFASFFLHAPYMRSFLPFSPSLFSSLEFTLQGGRNEKKSLHIRAIYTFRLRSTEPLSFSFYREFSLQPRKQKREEERKRGGGERYMENTTPTQYRILVLLLVLLPTIFDILLFFCLLSFINLKSAYAFFSPSLSFLLLWKKNLQHPFACTIKSRW